MKILYLIVKLSATLNCPPSGILNFNVTQGTVINAGSSWSPACSCSEQKEVRFTFDQDEAIKALEYGAQVFLITVRKGDATGIVSEMTRHKREEWNIIVGSGTRIGGSNYAPGAP